MYHVEFWLPIVAGEFTTKSYHDAIVNEVVECPTGYRLDGVALPKCQVTKITKLNTTVVKPTNVGKIISKVYGGDKKGRKLPVAATCAIEHVFDKVLAERIGYIKAAFTEVHGRDMFSDEHSRYIQPIVESVAFAVAVLRVTTPDQAISKRQIKDASDSIRDMSLRIELDILSQEPPVWLKKSIRKNQKRHKPS